MEPSVKVGFGGGDVVRGGGIAGKVLEGDGVKGRTHECGGVGGGLSRWWRRVGLGQKFLGQAGFDARSKGKRFEFGEGEVGWAIGC